MDSLTIAGIVFAAIFGGALLGMFIRSLLRDHHLNSDSKDLVKVTMGLVATMSALILGLMVASAKSQFDAQRAGVAQLAGNVIVLDRTLARYGPEAKDARETLKNAVADIVQHTWPDEGTDAKKERLAGTEGQYEHVYVMIESLKPATDSQKTLQAQALKIVYDIGQSRWLLFAQRGRSIPTPFLVVMVAWVSLLFASFSMFAPRNVVTVTALIIAALAVTGAMFLILELDQPFEGILRIPSTPLRTALERLGK